MKLNYLISFLRENLFLYILLFCLFSIYLITFLLFNVPILVILYPTFLFFILFLIISIFRYRKWKEQIIKIEKLKQTTIEELTELIPFVQTNFKESSALIETIFNLLEKLKQTQSLVAFKNKQMQDYISTWIHQIKIPITSMNLILDEMDTEDSRKIKSDLFRIELYIEMVLTYFRLESVSTDYVFTKVDLNELIHSEIKRFASEFIKRRIKLDLEIEPTNIITDEKWLAFIIDQLLSNALKYSFNQGLIKIKLDQDRLSIVDNGIGIAENDLPRIFERGFTGENGRKDKRASGLGLFLVKQVCDNLKIPITISSKPNHGTTVNLLISQSHQLFE